LEKDLDASGNIEAEAATGDLLVSQVRTGALDAAIVYRSNVLATPQNIAEHLDMIKLGEGLQAMQPLAIARSSQHKYLARRLETALAGPQSRQEFQHLGFNWVLDERQP